MLYLEYEKKAIPIDTVRTISILLLYLTCIECQGQVTPLPAKPEYAISANATSENPQPGRLIFHPLDSSFSSSTSWPDSVRDIWLRFTLDPTTNRDTSVILHLNIPIPLFYLYRPDSHGGLSMIGNSGYELPYTRRSWRGNANDIPFVLSAAGNQTYYLRFSRYQSELKTALPSIESKDKALLEDQYGESRRMRAKIIQLFLAGFFLAICFYSMLKFFSQSKDKVYLYYALVNFFCFLGLAVYYHMPRFESSLFPWCKDSKEYCAIFSDITIVFNILFLRTIMELKTNANRIYRISQVYIVFHIIATVLIPVIAANPAYIVLGWISDLLYPICELLCLALYFLFTFYLWKHRTGFYTFLFYGSCVMTIGMFMFTLSSIYQTHEAFISKQGTVGEYIIMALFVIAQVCFFVMAMTQREKQADQARHRRISEMELKVLRSQMNPHFIFNSLNSIENFMMKNDKVMASDYFGKFASLMRMILDNSRNEWVPFRKDIQALQLYVELEQLRFANRFLYITEFDQVLLSGEFNVPPLLIQPYVENAILHGLAQSDKDELRLTITVAFENDHVVYTIEDNGIGRQKAEEYRRNKLSHKGMGMKISQERISILNQQQAGMGAVEVTDLYGNDGQPEGTRVRVKFKAV